MTIRALLMDADGVVQYPRSGWLERFARLGGPGFTREAFRREMSTLTGQVDLRDELAEIIADGGHDATPEDFIEIWCDIEVDAYMLRLVDRVRAAGVVTALATNQQSYRGTHMLTNLPHTDHFDYQFHSFQMGLAKPDPAFFRYIIEALGIAADEAVFVDDMEINVRGAREAGLQGVYFSAADTYGHLRSRLRELGVPGI
ncbi:MAG TPA: HAD-IA family hydrolase [Propionicimonas sp.]|nr:HAD-IA family hydrolase [Propionicimonas sp.]